MAAAASQCTLNDLPEEIHRKIIQFLTPNERQTLAKINIYWRSIVYGNCQRIAFFHAHHNYEICYNAYKILQNRNIVSFKLVFWEDILNSIRDISSVTTIRQLSIYGCPFSLDWYEDETEAHWDNIGNCLPNLTHILLAHTWITNENITNLLCCARNLKVVELISPSNNPYCNTNSLREIFSNNHSLESLSLLFCGNHAPSVILQSNSLNQLQLHSETFDISDNIESVNLVKRFISLRTLHLYGFSCSPLRNCVFGQLCQIRLIHIDSGFAKLIGGKQNFPLLQEFTLHVNDPEEENIADFQCLFSQNNNLVVLNTNLIFSRNNEIIRLCEEYQKIEFLVLRLNILLSHESFISLSHLTALKYIVWKYSAAFQPSYATVDNQLSALVSAWSPTIRVFHSPNFHFRFLRRTRKLLRKHFWKNPHTDFFIDVEGENYFRLSNVRFISRFRLGEIFDLWKMPNCSNSYFEWEELSRNLNKLFYKHY